MGRRSPRRGSSLKLRLVSVGKDKSETASLAEEYASRIRRFAELEVVELKADSSKEKEATALLAKVRGQLWALDERGTELSSVHVAERIGRLRDSARDLTLCIGGDEGLAESVRSSAQLVWSLSKLTLPHRLARVVALEQVYRAFEILRGAPYHK